MAPTAATVVSYARKKFYEILDLKEKTKRFKNFLFIYLLMIPLPALPLPPPTF